MKSKIIYTWYWIRHSYWFFPAIMVLGSIVLHYITIFLDDMMVAKGWAELYSWMYPNKPQGARAVLSTIAGSMITVAGVVFSITMVALTLASTQFGPRLLINFIRDKGNQFVLGTFISTFVYCLLILRTIRDGEDTVYVPDLSVSVGVILALLSIAVLIFFIHHVAQSIQASNIIQNVKNDLDHTVNRLFPETGISSNSSVTNPWATIQDIPHDFVENSAEVTSSKNGYIQGIDISGIAKFALDNDVIVKMIYKPGNYLFNGSIFARVYPEERSDEINKEKLINYVMTGNKRTNSQDIEFAIDQLVEIAVRSLSPGINDPFTAITCVDQLGDVMYRLRKKSFPGPRIYDKKNRLRVIRKRVTYSDLMDTAFNQIRQNSTTVASVTIRLLATMRLLSEGVNTEEVKHAVLMHTRMIYRGAETGLHEELDKNKAKDIYLQTLANLGVRDG